MDPLFSKLIRQLDQLIVFGDQSFSQLSELGCEHKKEGLLDFEQQYWRTILEELRDKKSELGSLESNNKLPKTVLAFLREMPRRVSEGPPVWSSLYHEIEASINQLEKTRAQIDKKYALGRYATLQQWKKYHLN